MFSACPGRGVADVMECSPTLRNEVGRERRGLPAAQLSGRDLRSQCDLLRINTSSGRLSEQKGKVRTWTRAQERGKLKDGRLKRRANKRQEAGGEGKEEAGRSPAPGQPPPPPPQNGRQAHSRQARMQSEAAETSQGIQGPWDPFLWAAIQCTASSVPCN